MKETPEQTLARLQQKEEAQAAQAAQAPNGAIFSGFVEKMLDTRVPNG